METKTEEELTIHYGNLYTKQCEKRRMVYRCGKNQEGLTHKQQQRRNYNQEYYRRNKDKINKRVNAYQKDFYYYGVKGKNQMEMKPLFDWYVYAEKQKEIDKLYRRDLRARSKLRPLFHDI